MGRVDVCLADGDMVSTMADGDMSRFQISEDGAQRLEDLSERKKDFWSHRYTTRMTITRICLGDPDFRDYS